MPGVCHYHFGTEPQRNARRPNARSFSPRPLKHFRVPGASAARRFCASFPLAVLRLCLPKHPSLGVPRDISCDVKTGGYLRLSNRCLMHLHPASDDIVCVRLRAARSAPGGGGGGGRWWGRGRGRDSHECAPRGSGDGAGRVRVVGATTVRNLRAEFPWSAEMLRDRSLASGDKGG